MNTATTYSPLIKDGKLTLLQNGNLEYAPDILTQVSVATSAYNCIYDSTIDSELIPYLRSIPVGGINTTKINNILTSAYANLIQGNVISNLQISVIPIALNYITINVSCVDAQGIPILFSWDNTNLQGLQN